MSRVLLLVPALTYRAADFLAAADRMGLDLVVGSDGALPLGDRPVVHVSPADLPGSADRTGSSSPRLAPARRSSTRWPPPAGSSAW
jgi:hypothetical protein